MSKTETTEQETTKVWKNVDYTQSWAYKTIQAWKKKATEAGLVLEYPYDFPNDPVGQLDHLRRIDGMTDLEKGLVEKTVTKIFRQMVNSRDSNNKPVSKEYITYSGEFNIKDRRGAPYSHEFKEGVYQEPNVVINTTRKYDQNTGEPLGNDKILSGQRNVLWIELPKEKAARKKFIDNIIESTDSIKETIRYYYQDMGEHNFANKRDASFSYDEFVSLSIDELKDLSARGTASKAPGYWRDRDGVLRDKDGNKI